VNYKIIKAGWMKWRSALRVLGDHRFPIKLKGEFYKIVIRLALLYGIEYWAIKNQHFHKISIA